MTKEFLFLTFVSEFFLLSGSLQYASKITRGIDYDLRGQGDVCDEWEESNANSCSEAINPGRQLMTGQPLSLTRTEWIKVDRLVLTGALC